VPLGEMDDGHELGFGTVQEERAGGRHGAGLMWPACTSRLGVWVACPESVAKFAWVAGAGQSRLEAGSGLTVAAGGSASRCGCLKVGRELLLR
jgi:hypothetical protein